jgi:shikimate dehydrogenase
MGWPVEHSLSPVMHNAALRALDLNWCYVPLPVHPGGVIEAVRGAGALGFRGMNVTVPHKRAVIPALDRVAPEAMALGAVNTLVIERREDGSVHLSGHNTDVDGFLGSLRAGGFEPAGAGAGVVVGAGGAARAVVYGLLKAGMDRVWVVNRTPARAEALVADMVKAGLAADRLRVASLTRRTLMAAAQEAALLVNATTVGMWPRMEASIWPADVAVPSHLAVYDLVYNPLQTLLLRQARTSGARPMDGLDMLARQGALALDLWVGGTLDIEAVTAQMRRVCARALQDGG